MFNIKQLLQPHLSTEMWSAFQFLVFLFIVLLIVRYLFKEFRIKRSKKLDIL